MIQDIYPHKFYNEYRPAAELKDDSPVLCFQGFSILANQSDAAVNALVKFPSFKEVSAARSAKGYKEETLKSDIVYAFALDDTEYFIDISEEIYQIEGFEYLNLHSIRQKTGHEYGMVMYTGHHLYQWYDASRYCGKCSEKTIHSSTERAMKCSCCGKTIYPRLMPAVIVGVTNGDKLLVTQYNGAFKHYALVAGFTEIGETLEECVAREVMEETGIKVKNIRYFASQPWGIAQDLLAGFYCDADGNCEITMDANELKLAEWRSREDIILQPDDYSLTNHMMRCFKEGKNI